MIFAPPSWGSLQRIWFWHAQVWITPWLCERAIYKSIHLVIHDVQFLNVIISWIASSPRNARHLSVRAIADPNLNQRHEPLYSNPYKAAVWTSEEHSHVKKYSTIFLHKNSSLILDNNYYPKLVLTFISLRVCESKPLFSPCLKHSRGCMAAFTHDYIIKLERHWTTLPVKVSYVNLGVCKSIRM